MAKKSKPTNKRTTGGRKSNNTNWAAGKEEKIELKKLAKDERTLKIIGFVCLLISIFLLVSFLSYFFTWRQDYTQVSRGSDFLFDPDAQAENIFGKLGALSAHLFINKLFGVASALICTFFFVVGINLIVQRKIYSVWRNLKYVTLGMVVLSTALAFVLKGQEFSWGGGVGNWASDWLTKSLGFIGTAAVLVLIGIAYIIWQFNPAFSFPKRLVRSAAAVAATTTDVDDETAVDAVNSDVPALQTANDSGDGAKLIIDDSATNPQYEMTSFLKDEEGEEKDIQKLKKEEAAKGISVTHPEEKLPQPATASQQEKVLVIPPATPKTKPVLKETDDLKLEINSDPIKPLEQENPILATNRSKPYEPTLDLKGYQYPDLNLLETHGSEKIEQDPQDLENNKNQIINTLRNYDIEIQKISATIGPTVTLYEIVPAAGVRISRIKNLEDDIALSLAALGIRIIAPIPGRGTVGIEVPNTKKTIVSMKTLLSSEKYQHSNFSLPIALGKKIDNENFIVDLATMPHLLMAGATGQGKSVGINAVLVSLLYKKHPSQLKFVLVDPKKVELSIYSKIENHFLAKLPNEEDAIITDTKKVINTLNALCIEMDNRYDLLKDAGCRNIKEYNTKFAARRLNPEKGHQFLPFIVLVIDEFADLIMTAGKEVEMPIARLAQLARAVGIHLIIATQRPSVNIITGIIKANFPARVAFKVSSKIDSRTILDLGGAEQLIGKGDMLVSYNGEIVRLQCAFVDTPEVDKIVDYIGYQEGYPQPFLLPEYVDEKDLESDDFDLGDRDALFEDAARLIVANQIGSTSLLQRRMKLGYNRAGRLMDQLEAAGIVGPNQGSKARDVLIKTEADLQQHLDMLG